MEPINFFNSVDYLEPHCPQCRTTIKYDVSTRWDDSVGSHVCMHCGKPV